MKVWENQPESLEGRSPIFEWNAFWYDPFRSDAGRSWRIVDEKWKGQ